VLAGRADDGVTVDVRHLQVGHHGVERLAPQGVDRGRPGGEGGDLVPVVLE